MLMFKLHQRCWHKCKPNKELLTQLLNYHQRKWLKYKHKQRLRLKVKLLQLLPLWQQDKLRQVN